MYVLRPVSQCGAPNPGVPGAGSPGADGAGRGLGFIGISVVGAGSNTVVASGSTGAAGATGGAGREIAGELAGVGAGSFAGTVHPDDSGQRSSFGAGVS